MRQHHLIQEWGNQIIGSPIPVDAGVTIHADPTGDAGPSPTFDIVEVRTVRGAADIQVRVWTVPDPVLPLPGTFPTGSQFSGGVGLPPEVIRRRRSR